MCKCIYMYILCVSHLAHLNDRHETELCNVFVNKVTNKLSLFFNGGKCTYPVLHALFS